MQPTPTRPPTCCQVIQEGLPLLELQLAHLPGPLLSHTVPGAGRGVWGGHGGRRRFAGGWSRLATAANSCQQSCRHAETTPPPFCRARREGTLLPVCPSPSRDAHPPYPPSLAPPSQPLLQAALVLHTCESSGKQWPPAGPCPLPDDDAWRGARCSAPPASPLTLTLRLSLALSSGYGWR